MFKKIVSILFFFNYLNCLSQNNLVPNYSFENVYPSYYTFLNSDGVLYYSNEPVIDNHAYWNNIYNWTWPDNPFGCTHVGSADILPNSLLTSTAARSGTKVGHGFDFEYLVVKLTNTLTVNNYYYVEFYKYFTGGENTTDPNFDIGIRFFENRPKQQCLGPTDWLKPSESSECKIPSGSYAEGWHKFSFIFIPNNQYEWIALGNHGEWDDQGGYWDDIKIIDLGTTTCPPLWLFENTTFENENRIYQSSNLIIAGENVDPQTINGPVIVKDNSNILFKAANQIILDPGFSTEPGATFEAKIEPCGNLCPFIPSQLNDKELCDNLPTQIGYSNPESGLSYQWSPATYLDDPTSANPIFTAPPGTGSITYTVTISSICGGFVNGFSFMPTVDREITIYYTDNPNSTPVLNVSNVNTSNFELDFDLSFGIETQEICISAINQTTGSFDAGLCFDLPEDLNCCNYSFHLEDYEDFLNLSPCFDYTIHIQSKNICSSILTTETINWERNQSYNLVHIPNVIALNSSQGNDKWKISAEGVSRYEITIYDNNNAVYSYQNNVTSNPFVIWQGECNTIHCSPACINSPNGVLCPCLNDGTYAYVLHLIDCDEIDHDYSGLITFFSGNFNFCYETRTSNTNDNTILFQQNLMAENYDSHGDSLIDTETKFSFELFPNPTNSDFRLNFKNRSFETKVTIYNSSGQEIYVANYNQDKVIINSEKFVQGFYIIKVKSGNEVVYEKLIKQ